MGKEGKEEGNEVRGKGREEGREGEVNRRARQVMRSEGSGRECLLADYLELGKIKRHTHIQSYLLSSFLSLSHTHREEIGVLQGVIPRILFGVRRNSLRREEAKEREGEGERRGEERGVSFYTPIIKTENPSWKKRHGLIKVK